METGDTIRTFDTPAVGWLAMSADGTRLAVERSGAPYTVTVLDTSTGEPVGPAIDLPWSAGLALDPSGTRLAAGATGLGDARLIDVATGQVLGDPLAGEWMGVVLQRRWDPARGQDQQRPHPRVRRCNRGTGS